MLGQKAAQHLGQVLRERRGAAHEAHMTLEPLAVLAELAAQALHLLQHDARMVQQRAAGLGRAHALRMAREQRAAEGVFPAAHALAGRRRVHLAEVVDSEFVGLPADSALQLLLTQHARALGRHLAYRVRVGNFEAVCRMVVHGIGVGIVPQTAAERCARSMKIARAALGDAWAERTLMACVRSSQELPLNARRMLEHLVAPVEQVAAK